MSGQDILLNLISFGAFGQVQKVSMKYEGIFLEYKGCHGAHENHIRDLGEALSRLSEEKKSALLEAKKNSEIASKFDAEDHDFAEKEISATDYSLPRMNETLKVGEVTLSVVPGFLAGAAAVFAVWIIVGKYGKTMATSIAALASADRISASLMWLGGGALPGHAGNGALGALILVGIFLIPMLLVTTSIFRFFSVRKIRKTEEALAEVESVIRQIKEDLPRLESLKKKVDDMTQAVKASKQLFLEWHEVCCMTDTQRKQKLMTLAASMIKILHTPLEQSVPEPGPETPSSIS